jgi:hypothetical protein
MINIANALQTTIQAALPRLRALSEQDAQRDRGEGKWVVKQILGHLIDSAANNHQRFVRARGADPVVFPGYDQDAWVAAHAYTIRPWLELIDIWMAYNAQVAEVISSTPSERRQVQCRIGDAEPATLEWLMTDYVRHMRHHLEQIVPSEDGKKC